MCKREEKKGDGNIPFFLYKGVKNMEMLLFGGICLFIGFMFGFAFTTTYYKSKLDELENKNQAEIDGKIYVCRQVFQTSDLINKQLDNELKKLNRQEKKDETRIMAQNRKLQVR